MKYMGSKNRYAKELLPIILKDREKDQYYIEPFVGGANIIDKVTGNRFGCDNNKYLIGLLKALQLGWLPNKINKDRYNDIRNNKNLYKDEIVGYAGICCSYSGKWFGGFAGEVETKGGLRDYQQEAISNIVKQAQNIKDMAFKSCDYKDFYIPKNSIIYCDPPYKNTTGYVDNFNHDEFWGWCDMLVKSGHKVFVSEYNAPQDWECVWEKEVKSSLSANGKYGSSKKSTEKLFTK